MSVRSFCLLAGFVGFSVVAIGAPAGEEQEGFEHQLGSQKALLEDIDIRIEEMKEEVKEKSVLFHNLKQKPAQGPLYLWMADNRNKASQKDRSLKILSLSLKETVRDLELLQARRVEAQAELEWIQIQQQEYQKRAGASQEKVLANFNCQTLPLKSAEKLELIQGFGPQRDLETDLEWNSLGWWFSSFQSEVQACADATVVFVGEISGRGRVVMLDHGGGHMTVYANLNPATLRSLRKDQKVRAGHVLGLSLDRLYFEYRQKGVAAHPKSVLRAESLSRIVL